MSVCDERCSIDEIALHGEVFAFGSHEELVALDILCRRDCRGIMLAWFNDPSIDRPHKYYALARYEWAVKALERLSEEERSGARARRIQAIIARDKDEAMLGKLTIGEENRRNRNPTTGWD